METTVQTHYPDVVPSSPCSYTFNWYSVLAEMQQISILLSFVWPDRARINDLQSFEAIMLTSPQPMGSKSFESVFHVRSVIFIDQNNELDVTI